MNFISKAKKPQSREYTGMILYGTNSGDVHICDKPQLLLSNGEVLHHRLNRVWAPEDWTLDDILVELMKRYEPNGGIAAEFEK